jgi:soluble lytic murein transglycosylase-like protein
MTESSCKADAKSPAGAVGIMQIMPKWHGVDAEEPVSSIFYAAWYLKKQYQRFGSWRLAIAAYNAGPSAVAKYDDVPPYQETRAYVRRVFRWMSKFYQGVVNYA